jgi:roadblock/LC7 domain-containing protein
MRGIASVEGAGPAASGRTGLLASLDELLQFEGVVAAGEWAKDGSLSDYKASMDMSPELAAAAAQFCATVSMMFETLSGAFSQTSGMTWTPQQGWAYSGGEWTVAVGGGGRKGVFVETARAGLQQTLRRSGRLGAA